MRSMLIKKILSDQNLQLHIIIYSNFDCHEHDLSTYNIFPEIIALDLDKIARSMLIKKNLSYQNLLINTKVSNCNANIVSPIMSFRTSLTSITSSMVYKIKAEKIFWVTQKTILTSTKLKNYSLSQTYPHTVGWTDLSPTWDFLMTHSESPELQLVYFLSRLLKLDIF